MEGCIELGMFICGSPKTVRETLLARQQEIGFGNLISQFQFGTLPHDLTMRNIEYLAPTCGRFCASASRVPRGPLPAEHLSLGVRHAVETRRHSRFSTIRRSAFQIQLLILSFLVMMIDGYDIGAAAFAGPSLIHEWACVARARVLFKRDAHFGLDRFAATRVSFRPLRTQAHHRVRFVLFRHHDDAPS